MRILVYGLYLTGLLIVLAGVLSTTLALIWQLSLALAWILGGVMHLKYRRACSGKLESEAREELCKTGRLRF